MIVTVDIFIPDIPPQFPHYLSQFNITMYYTRVMLVYAVIYAWQHAW